MRLADALDRPVVDRFIMGFLLSESFFVVCVEPCYQGMGLECVLDLCCSFSRGQQGVHSSAANEDGFGYSVKEIGTPTSVYLQQSVYFCDL